MKLITIVLFLLCVSISYEMNNNKTLAVKFIYSHLSPITAEVIAIASIEKLPLITTPLFIEKEIKLMTTFLIMNNVPPLIAQQAGRVLLNLILCNNKVTHLRTFINIILDGYKGKIDEESMTKINNLIQMSIIDTLLKTKFYYYNDIQAQIALIKMFNKEIHKKMFSNVEMLEFININCELVKPFKEMLIGMIMRLSDSDKGNVIDAFMEESIFNKEIKIVHNTIPSAIIPQSPKILNQVIKEKNIKQVENEQEHIKNLRNEIQKLVGSKKEKLNQPDTSIVRKLTQEEAIETLNEIKKDIGFSFKQRQENYIVNQNNKNNTYIDINRFIEQEDLPLNKTLHVKLNEIKNQLKNTYMDFLYNKTYSSLPLKENTGIDNRSIFTKYKSHIDTLLQVNELLKPFPLSPHTLHNVNILEPKHNFNIHTNITKNINGVNFTMQFKQSEFAKESFSKIITDNNSKSVPKGVISKEVFDKMISYKNTNSPNSIIISNIISSLFSLLRSIQENNTCSDGFLCIEIGVIKGPFNIKESNITPIVPKQPEHIINNKTNSTVEPKKNENVPPRQREIIINDDDDCDELTMMSSFNPIRFKEIEHTNITYNVTTKLYRKVVIGNMIYSQDIFNEGMNMIIVKRNINYDRIYEKTFNTASNRNDSEEMASILEKVECDSIVIITAFGQYNGAITQRLVTELKQIGITERELDSIDNNKILTVIGRRGLCRNNGYVQSKVISIQDNSNTNDDSKFTSTVLYSSNLDLSSDNRFGFKFPTVCSVTPRRGIVLGGQHISIKGLNFGNHTTDIKEVLVKGVACGDVLSMSSNEITCVTRDSSIIGEGAGSVVVKMNNEMESPDKVCNYFEYVGNGDETKSKFLNKQSKIRKNSTIEINDNEGKESVIDFYRRNEKEILKRTIDQKAITEAKINNLIQDNMKRIISSLNSENENIIEEPVIRRRYNKKNRFQFILDQFQH